MCTCFICTYMYMIHVYGKREREREIEQERKINKQLRNRRQRRSKKYMAWCDMVCAYRLHLETDIVLNVFSRSSLVQNVPYESLRHVGCNPYGTLDALWCFDNLCISVLSCIITDICLILFDFVWHFVCIFESLWIVFVVVLTPGFLLFRGPFAELTRGWYALVGQSWESDPYTT